MLAIGTFRHFPYGHNIPQIDGSSSRGTVDLDAAPYPGERRDQFFKLSLLRDIRQLGAACHFPLQLQRSEDLAAL